MEKGNGTSPGGYSVINQPFWVDRLSPIFQGCARTFCPVGLGFSRLGPQAGFTGSWPSCIFISAPPVPGPAKPPPSAPLPCSSHANNRRVLPVLPPGCLLKLFSPVASTAILIQATIISFLSHMQPSDYLPAFMPLPPSSASSAFSAQALCSEHTSYPNSPA